MARETRIGVALMMLLTGVFGFMVYQRWNSDRPTDLALAGELRKQLEESQEQTDKPSEEDDVFGKEPTLAAPMPVADGSDPFGAAPGNPPASEPDAMFKENLGNPFEEASTSDLALTEKPTAPVDDIFGNAPANVEVTPVGEAESPLPEPVPAMAAEDSPFGESPAPTPDGDENPFGGVPEVAADAMAPNSDEPAVAAKDSAPPEEPEEDVMPFAPSEPAVAATAIPRGPTPSPSPPAPNGDSGAAMPNEPPPEPELATAETEPFGSAEMEAASAAPPDDGLPVSPFTEDAKPDDSANIAAMPPAEPQADVTEPSTTAAPPEDDPFGAMAESPFSADPPADSADPPAEPFAMDAQQPTDGLAESPFGESPSMSAEGVASSPPAPAEEAMSPFGAEPDSDTASGAAPPVQAPEEMSPFGDPPQTAATEPAASDTPPNNNQLTDAGNSEASGGSEYVVKPNDTYWTISQAIYGSPMYAQALAQFNSGTIPDPNRLAPGMKIPMPPLELLKERYGALIATGSRGMAPAQPRGGFFLTETGDPAFRVTDSDTLQDIAKAHLGRPSRWVQIFEMNREVIEDPDKLEEGTILRLPVDASRVRLVSNGET